MKPILQTLLFTACVPGTVAGLVPWLLRRGAASPGVPLAAFWLGAALLVLGAAAYLHTAFWGFALRGRGTPAPVAPTARPRHSGRRADTPDGGLPSKRA